MQKKTLEESKRFYIPFNISLVPTELFLQIAQCYWHSKNIHLYLQNKKNQRFKFLF